MAVTNLMQDIVINTLDEVLKNENASDIPPADRDDIIAYVLNRVNPKYVTSERGLLHGILDARYQVQQRVDILFLIYEAYYRILKHAGSPAARHETPSPEGASMLPHIVGQVLDESTLSMIPGVEVVLLHEDAPAPMVDKGWDNPYRTNESTNGHYHFWPRYVEADMGTGGSVRFTLSFRHPDFSDASLPVELEMIGKTTPGKTRFIEPVLMAEKG